MTTMTNEFPNIASSMIRIIVIDRSTRPAMLQYGVKETTIFIVEDAILNVDDSILKEHQTGQLFYVYPWLNVSRSLRLNSWS